MSWLGQPAKSQGATQLGHDAVILGHRPASATGPTGQASSVVQGKSSVSPDNATHAKTQTGSPGVQGVCVCKGNITDKGADIDDDENGYAPSLVSKSHTQGKESKKTSSSASTRKKR